MTRFWLFVFLLAGVSVTGCESRPKAPILSNAPVYENRAEGLRFLVPDGWIQTASAVLPPGDLPDEQFLVRYSLQTSDGGATLQVLVLQEKTPIDLAVHHEGPSFRVQKWLRIGGREDLKINGTTVEHYNFSAKIEGREMTKEVYAVRGNGRVYSFVGMYGAKDVYARQQIARAVNSLQKN